MYSNICGLPCLKIFPNMLFSILGVVFFSVILNYLKCGYSPTNQVRPKEPGHLLHIEILVWYFWFSCFIVLFEEFWWLVSRHQINGHHFESIQIIKKNLKKKDFFLLPVRFSLKSVKVELAGVMLTTLPTEC